MQRPGVVLLGVVATVAAIAWIASGAPHPARGVERAENPASDRRLRPASDALPTPVIRADGRHVYHNYPFQMKQPDGSFATVPVTVCFTPVPAAPVLPPEAESAPPR
jgi:hypothetical protein